MSNVRETGRKIEGKTGQRAELSNVWETGWKIEGMTDGKPGQRTGLRVGIELCNEVPGRTASVLQPRAETPSGGPLCGRGEVGEASLQLID